MFPGCGVGLVRTSSKDYNSGVFIVRNPVSQKKEKKRKKEEQKEEQKRAKKREKNRKVKKMKLKRKK
jgi:hypothetical protein